MRRSAKVTFGGALVAGLAALVSGCGGGVEPGRTADLASALVRIIGCPNDLCGGTKLMFTDGRANYAGVTLEGILGDDRGLLKAVVTGDHLRAVDANGNRYEDFDLLDEYLLVHTRRGAFEIDIHGLVVPELWVDGSPRGNAYDLRYRPSTSDRSGPWKAFCGSTEASVPWRGTSGLAFIFRGDDIDPTTNSVSTSHDEASFSMACAGDPIAGLYMAGHSAASDPNKVTSESDRQAMLKMLAGDYCGTGVSYAFDTPPEHFVDATGRLPPLADAPTAKTLEAVWTDKGAVCLQNPRFPEQANQIAAACSLPRCDQLLPDGIPGLLKQWQQLGHVLSANAPQ
jgi:ADYC domain